MLITQIPNNVCAIKEYNREEINSASKYERKKYLHACTPPSPKIKKKRKYFVLLSVCVCLPSTPLFLLCSLQ